MSMAVRDGVQTRGSDSRNALSDMQPAVQLCRANPVSTLPYTFVIPKSGRYRTSPSCGASSRSSELSRVCTSSERPAQAPTFVRVHDWRSRRIAFEFEFPPVYSHASEGRQNAGRPSGLAMCELILAEFRDALTSSPRREATVSGGRMG
uniref:Velvet domain-containing protein n=1 Tax=Macrostomum lignano TaxID=282301 RepID=A0A1I8JQI9_9PLAT